MGLAQLALHAYPHLHLFTANSNVYCHEPEKWTMPHMLTHQRQRRRRRVQRAALLGLPLPLCEYNFTFISHGSSQLFRRHVTISCPVSDRTNSTVLRLRGGMAVEEEARPQNSSQEQLYGHHTACNVHGLQQLRRLLGRLSFVTPFLCSLSLSSSLLLPLHQPGQGGSRSR